MHKYSFVCNNVYKSICFTFERSGLILLIGIY